MSVFAVVLTIVGVALVLFSLIIVVLRQKSKLIFGIYPSKGFFYIPKYGIALLVLKRLRHKFYHSNAEQLNDPAYLERLDRPQALSDNPQSYDVVSFLGADALGRKLLVTLERRRRGLLKAALYVWLPGEGLLCSPNLPDMVHFTTDGTHENEEFRGSGFHIYPDQCMRRWRIRYDGTLRQVVDNTELAVQLDLKFASCASYFNYNRDLSAAVIADSVAREAWNDAFYSMLKNVDQVLERRLHYEQSGQLEGELRLGERVVTLRLSGFRDHSFGTERCLSTINRYVYFALFLADGTSMMVGNLSQPSFFLSSLKVGYVCTPAGDYQPITHCNYELYSYGEKGSPPKHQNFIVATATANFFVQINEEETAVRYVGADWESKVYTQFVSCTVNGVKGQGITEYLYRNKRSGRPESESDPEWYKRVRSYERSLSSGENKDDEEVFVF